MNCAETGDTMKTKSRSQRAWVGAMLASTSVLCACANANDAGIADTPTGAVRHAEGVVDAVDAPPPAGMDEASSAVMPGEEAPIADEDGDTLANLNQQLAEVEEEIAGLERQLRQVRAAENDALALARMAESRERSIRARDARETFENRRAERMALEADLNNATVRRSQLRMSIEGGSD